MGKDLLSPTSVALLNARPTSDPRGRYTPALLPRDGQHVSAAAWSAQSAWPFVEKGMIDAQKHAGTGNGFATGHTVRARAGVPGSFQAIVTGPRR